MDSSWRVQTADLKREDRSWSEVETRKCWQTGSFDDVSGKKVQKLHTSSGSVQ